MKGKTLLIIGGVLVLVAAAVGFNVWKKNQSSAVTYNEIPVIRGDLSITVLATGVVQPENRVEIKPPIAGRVETVLVQEGQQVQKGQVLAWMSSTERAAMLDAARAQGEEEVKRWEQMYKPTAILAPVNGTIIQRNIESGQTFTTTDAILVMSDRLTVKAQVDETDIAQIKLKQKATMVLDAYSGRSISATVDQIAYDAKTVNNVTTYIVDVLPDHTPEYMRSGMTANVTFILDSKADVLVIPASAIRMRDKTPIVLVSGTAGGARSSPVERAIETGITDGKHVEIVSGLVAGDIVFEPKFNLGPKANTGTSPFTPMRPRGGGAGGGRPH